MKRAVNNLKKSKAQAVAVNQTFSHTLHGFLSHVSVASQTSQQAIARSVSAVTIRHRESTTPDARSSKPASAKQHSGIIILESDQEAPVTNVYMFIFLMHVLQTNMYVDILITS